MKSWRTNWDAIVPIFKFSLTLRTIVYTTNAIESLNATYVFPNATALLKALFFASELATKKWTMPLQNWGLIYGEVSIIFEGRLPFNSAILPFAGRLAMMLEENELNPLDFPDAKKIIRSWQTRRAVGNYQAPVRQYA